MKLQLPWDVKPAEVKGVSRRYDRERSDAPYHTWRWTKLSRAFLADHPLCVECQRQGRYTPATVCDHIVPWPVVKARGGDFYDVGNLQPLCAYHNDLKGQRDKKIIARELGRG